MNQTTSSSINLVDADLVSSSVSGSLTSGSTANGTLLNNCTPYSPYWSSVLTYPYPIVYSTNVRKANNGFVIEHNGGLYIAKTEKELSKVLTNLFKKPNK